ncbi:MAG: N-acetylmuramoyl-L-alanine amidase [Proteobacteria bacterium]|jgi:N-acetylmuramoyl-L-alanine amidase|nr:N-acetylmuramoyl-L-alanine amidase [Pseudomonadota bacterium]
MKFIATKPKRYITKVFLHCSDSDLPQHDNPFVIRDWHLERGFYDIGYHFIITKDGTVHTGRSIEAVPAAQEGNNTGSIAICLTGRTTFSQMQFSALRKLCGEINQLYNNITFHGHCEVAAKLCPVFDYTRVLNLQEGKMPKQTDAVKTFFNNLLQLFI